MRNYLEKIINVFKKPNGIRSQQADNIIAQVVHHKNLDTKEIMKMNVKIVHTQTFFIAKALGTLK